MESPASPSNKKLCDLLQFETDPQSRRLKRNAVTCAFVPREGGSTRKVLSKLQLIEKFLVGRAEPGPTRSTKLQQIAMFCGARPVWPTHLRGWIGAGPFPSTPSVRSLVPTCVRSLHMLLSCMCTAKVGTIAPARTSRSDP